MTCIEAMQRYLSAWEQVGHSMGGTNTVVSDADLTGVATACPQDVATAAEGLAKEAYVAGFQATAPFDVDAYKPPAVLGRIKQLKPTADIALLRGLLPQK